MKQTQKDIELKEALDKMVEELSDQMGEEIAESVIAIYENGEYEVYTDEELLENSVDENYANSYNI